MLQQWAGMGIEETLQWSMGSYIGLCFGKQDPISHKVKSENQHPRLFSDFCRTDVIHIWPQSYVKSWVLAHKHMQRDFQINVAWNSQRHNFKKEPKCWEHHQHRDKVNVSCFKYFPCNIKHTRNTNICIICFLHNILNYYFHLPVRFKSSLK